MSAKLLYFYKTSARILLTGVFFTGFGLFQTGYSQDCVQDPLPDFKPATVGNFVYWQQFPEFSLPFKVIYGGQAPFGDPDLVLKRGFSHISNPHDQSRVPVANRALIYTGVAFPNQAQPWEVNKSPWGNDMGIYQRKWISDLTRFRQETGGQSAISADMLMYDIERQHRSNDSILVLRNHPATPAAYRSLSNDAFIEQYKRDLQQLYAGALQFARNNGWASASGLSSYADTPVWNTFTNIQGNTWAQWKQNTAVINYLNYDFDQKKVGGDFYHQMDFLAPSAYYYYDYPHQFAPEYLSYMMFQLEANRAWSDKDNILFVWMKYSFNQEYRGKFIKPWMAEATAIFPFFAGAKGLWFWDDFSGDLNTNYSVYEYFIKGLYRLSLFKDMFSGNYKLVEEIPARDYNENKLPVWRGVVKDNHILVAAHNPAAKSEQETVNVLVTYGSWSKVISLKGYEVFLCKYDMSIPSGLEPSGNISGFNLYPNPAEKDVWAEFHLKKNGKVKLFIHDLKGRLLSSAEYEAAAGISRYPLDIAGRGMHIVTLMNEGEQLSKRIFISNEP